MHVLIAEKLKPIWRKILSALLQTNALTTLKLPEPEGLTELLSPVSLQARLDITLETEADLSELDAALAQQEHSFTGFASQMWAYITIRQLIAER